MRYKKTKLIFDSDEMFDLESELAAIQIPKELRGLTPQKTLAHIHYNIAKDCLAITGKVVVANLRANLRSTLMQSIKPAHRYTDRDGVVQRYVNDVCNLRELTFYIPTVAKLFRSEQDVRIEDAYRDNFGIVLEVVHPEDTDYWQ